MTGEYSINITERAKKDFRKLNAEIRVKLINHVLLLRTNRKSKNIKMLVGPNIPKYRLRAGDYRVLFDVIHSQKEILIIRAGHRKEIHC